MSKSRLSALPGYRAGFLPNPTLAMTPLRRHTLPTRAPERVVNDAAVP